MMMMMPTPVLPQDKVDAYSADVVAAYAESFVQDAIYGAAVRLAANERVLAAAQAAHAAEVERVAAENARLAALHAREVEEKLVKEEQHRQVGARGDTAAGAVTEGGAGNRGKGWASGRC